MKSKELYPKLLLQYLVQGAGLERKSRESDIDMKVNIEQGEMNKMMEDGVQIIDDTN